ncbi:hypothetical protein [uncultured Croceitalea sp.]|uniref:hypothetical protein n=1 Tax=uncultured Croceitalea sp. TaxID=1798908 RepID=UPI003305A1E5
MVTYTIVQIESTVAKQQSAIFKRVGAEYIDQWFLGFVEGMNLSPEVARAYQDITRNYAARFKTISNKNQAIPKATVITEFNTLMEEHHEEVKLILSAEQYKIYSNSMEKAVWSINLHLKQL